MKFNTERGGGGGGAHFVRLKDGESVTGILRGDPIDYRSSFGPGDRPSFKFQVNIVVKENGALVAKIFKGSLRLYKQLDGLQGAGWNLERSYVQIKRTGSTIKDTVYTASILPTPPTEDVLKQVATVELRELKPDGILPPEGGIAPEPAPDFQTFKDDLPF